MARLSKAPAFFLAVSWLYISAAQSGPNVQLNTIVLPPGEFRAALLCPASCQISRVTVAPRIQRTFAAGNRTCNIQMHAWKSSVDPAGFAIQLYTPQNVTGARSIALGGTAAVPIVYVSSDGPGVVSPLKPLFVHPE